MRRPRVVITGATRGLGLQMARVFLPGPTFNPACLRFWTRTTSQIVTIERLIAAFVPERHALFLEPANL